MASSVQDRVASLQSGCLSAAIIGIVAVLCQLINFALSVNVVGEPIMPTVLDGRVFASIVFAILSGFLFGVTYRYIRRSDPNPHLRTGAIAAFGMTRGLAQFDTGALLQAQISSLLLMAGESMLMIAIAAIGLDWAMERGWIPRVP